MQLGKKVNRTFMTIYGPNEDKMAIGKEEFLEKQFKVTETRCERIKIFENCL